jgi:hypothetical protein
MPNTGILKLLPRSSYKYLLHYCHEIMPMAAVEQDIAINKFFGQDRTTKWYYSLPEPSIHILDFEIAISRQPLPSITSSPPRKLADICSTS